MKDIQMREVAAIISGQQLCITHLARVVAKKTGIELALLATSFEDVAVALDSAADLREIQMLPAQQVAQALRGAAAGDEWRDLLARIS